MLREIEGQLYKVNGVYSTVFVEAETKEELFTYLVKEWVNKGYPFTQ